MGISTESVLELESECLNIAGRFEAIGIDAYAWAVTPVRFPYLHTI